MITYLSHTCAFIRGLSGAKIIFYFEIINHLNSFAYTGKCVSTSLRKLRAMFALTFLLSGGLNQNDVVLSAPALFDSKIFRKLLTILPRGKSMQWFDGDTMMLG